MSVSIADVFVAFLVGLIDVHLDVYLYPECVVSVFF